MSQPPVRIQQVVCSYCRNTRRGADGLHADCPGAIRIPGTEKIIVCKCCTPKLGMCTTCGNRDKGDVDPITWYCLDRYACSARVQARIIANPLHKMLQDVRLDAAASRRRQRLEAARIQTGIDPEDPNEVDSFEVRSNGKPRRAARPKTAKCLCCGEDTKGGRFRPGHDAKLASQLLTRLDNADTANAWPQVVELGWQNKPAFRKRAPLDIPASA